MHEDTKLDRIHAIPLFAKCDRETLRDLASAVDEVDVRAGQRLITQGRSSHEAYIIESGSVSVLVDEEEVAEVGPGEIIGEIALLAPGPATATVVMKDPGTVLIMPHNRFDPFLINSPGLARSIAIELAERLRSMDERHTSS